MIKPRQKVIDALKEQIAGGSYQPGQRMPTLMELTDQLGVSRGTVCNALEELIREGILVKRPGSGCYLSDRAGTTPVIRRKIAFIAPGRTQANYLRILEGVENEAFQSGFELTFFNHGNDSLKARSIAEKITPGLYAGVILMPLIGPDLLSANQELLNILDRNGCHYVTVDTPVLTGGIIRGNYIGSDNYNAVRRLTEVLIRRGYRSFGSIRVFEGDGSATQRVAGLFDQLRVAGLPLVPEWHQVIEDVAVEEQGRSNLHAMLAMAERPEIVFCSYDLIAVNVCRELGRLGRRVPQEMAVYGFDGSERAELFNLTTIRQDFSTMGRRAAEILLESIRHARNGLQQEFIPCEPILRLSTERGQHTPEQVVS